MRISFYFRIFSTSKKSIIFVDIVLHSLRSICYILVFPLLFLLQPFRRSVMVNEATLNDHYYRVLNLIYPGYPMHITNLQTPTRVEKS